MARLALVVAIAVSSVACAVGQDMRSRAREPREAANPIDELVAKLSEPPIGLWKNGLFPTLGLPESASTEQLIARVFEMTGFDKGHVEEYRILETRVVRIPGSLPDIYTAVVVDTDLGEKIVLLKYERAAGWWSRVYDTQPSA